jgi:hypothetical protein
MLKPSARIRKVENPAMPIRVKGGTFNIAFD